MLRFAPVPSGRRDRAVRVEDSKDSRRIPEERKRVWQPGEDAEFRLHLEVTEGCLGPLFERVRWAE